MTDRPSPRQEVAARLAVQMGVDVHRALHHHSRRKKRYYRIEGRKLLVDVHAPHYIVVNGTLHRSEESAAKEIFLALR